MDYLNPYKRVPLSVPSCLQYYALWCATQLEQVLLFVSINLALGITRHLLDADVSAREFFGGKLPGNDINFDSSNQIGVLLRDE